MKMQLILLFGASLTQICHALKLSASNNTSANKQKEASSVDLSQRIVTVTNWDGVLSQVTDNGNESHSNFYHYEDHQDYDHEMDSTTAQNVRSADVPLSRASRASPIAQSTSPPVDNTKYDVKANFDWLATGKPTRATAKPPHDNRGSITVIEWRWPEVGIFFAFASFVVAAGIARAAFHRSHFLLTHVPESCLLIGMGAFVGSILYICGVEAPGDYTDGPTVIGMAPQPRDSPDYQPTPSTVTLPVLSPRLFFNVLIPPVILEASYTLYDRAVLANIYPILLHSILGKFINAISIGAALLVVERNGLMQSLMNNGQPLVSNYSLTVPDALMFSSIASGVDAAAVLPIFEENGVNKDLFFVLLGESLMNDAITVTLSEYTAKLAAMHTFDHEQYGKAILFLVAVSLGGLMFGILGGLASALVTRATHHCSAVEPLALLGLAYMSYISAELIQFSGHICIMGCGLLQAHYAFKNISHTSYNTVKDLTKMISSTSEAIIFLFLGMVLVSKNHSWNTGFVCWSVLFCLVIRTVVVVLICGLYAALGGRAMGFKDQLVLSYCGIRGAVCFCLAHMADPLHVAPRAMFITTLLVLIIVTTFLQGGTVKYLLDLLSIERSHWTHEKTVVQELHDQVLTTATSGIEDIIGTSPSILNPVTQFFQKIDEKYLMKIFVSQHEHTNMSRLFNEYSKSYSLSLLQHQLFLAIKDAQHVKKNSKVLMVMPTIFSNLARKIGPQILPMVYFGEVKRNSVGAISIVKQNAAPTNILDIVIPEEEEPKLDMKDGQHMVIEDVESPLRNNPAPPELSGLDKKDGPHMIIEDVENPIKNPGPPGLDRKDGQHTIIEDGKPPMKNPEPSGLSYINEKRTNVNEKQADGPPPIYREKKPRLGTVNRPPSVIERVLEHVTTPPSTSKLPNPQKVTTKIEDALEIINENQALSEITKTVPSQKEVQNKDNEKVPLEEVIKTLPSENNCEHHEESEFPTLILTRKSSKDNESEPRENTNEIVTDNVTPPEQPQPVHHELPSINVTTPSPNSTQSSMRFPFTGKRRNSGRQIPLFRPSQSSSTGIFNRKTSKATQDAKTPDGDNPLNTTAENLRRAVLDSPYRRMRYHGRHRELQADYERLTQAVLSRHLQAIDDELQLVMDVVGRCQIAIARIRTGHVSRTSRRTSEPSYEHSRELAAGHGSHERAQGAESSAPRKQPASAPETALDDIPVARARQRFSRDPPPAPPLRYMTPPINIAVVRNQSDLTNPSQDFINPLLSRQQSVSAAPYNSSNHWRMSISDNAPYGPYYSARGSIPRSSRHSSLSESPLNSPIEAPWSPIPQFASPSIASAPERDFWDAVSPLRSQNPARIGSINHQISAINPQTRFVSNREINPLNPQIQPLGNQIGNVNSPISRTISARNNAGAIRTVSRNVSPENQVIVLASKNIGLPNRAPAPFPDRAQHNGAAENDRVATPYPERARPSVMFGGAHQIPENSHGPRTMFRRQSKRNSIKRRPPWR